MDYSEHDTDTDELTDGQLTVGLIKSSYKADTTWHRTTNGAGGILAGNFLHTANCISIFGAEL